VRQRRVEKRRGRGRREEGKANIRYRWCSN